MSTTLFAFGPDGSYFMQSPSQWAWKNLPPSLDACFSPIAQAIVARVYYMALGSNGSYYMGFKDKEGNVRICQHGLPAELEAWLNVRDKNGVSVRSAKETRISLGPGNTSFWASDEHSIRYENLPEELNIALANLPVNPRGQLIDFPKLITLGVENTFVLALASGGGSAQLGTNVLYPELYSELLNRKARIHESIGMFKDVKYMSLNAHEPRTFVLATGAGRVASWFSNQFQPDAINIVDSIQNGTAQSKGAKAVTMQWSNQLRKGTAASMRVIKNFTPYQGSSGSGNHGVQASEDFPPATGSGISTLLPHQQQSAPYQTLQSVPSPPMSIHPSAWTQGSYQGLPVQHGQLLPQHQFTMQAQTNQSTFPVPQSSQYGAIDGPTQQTRPFSGQFQQRKPVGPHDMPGPVELTGSHIPADLPAMPQPASGYSAGPFVSPQMDGPAELPAPPWVPRT